MLDVPPPDTILRPIAEMEKHGADAAGLPDTS